MSDQAMNILAIVISALAIVMAVAAMILGVATKRRQEAAQAEEKRYRERRLSP